MIVLMVVRVASCVARLRRPKSQTTIIEDVLFCLFSAISTQSNPLVAKLYLNHLACKRQDLCRIDASALNDALAIMVNRTGVRVSSVSSKVRRFILTATTLLTNSWSPLQRGIQPLKLAAAA